MGIAAVEGLLKGQKDVMAGIKDNKMVYNDFATIMSEKYHEIDAESLRIAKILSI
jgi:6-phosphofructokinase 1